MNVKYKFMSWIRIVYQDRNKISTIKSIKVIC